MGSHFASARQRALFAAVTAAGPLLFACDKGGLRVNLEGEFQVRGYDKEDRLDLGDGTSHVHLEWARVTRAEVGLSRGEGALMLYDGDAPLFTLYRLAGPYGKEIEALAGALL